MSIHLANSQIYMSVEMPAPKINGQPQIYQLYKNKLTMYS
jgi:hypothetical protein